MKSQTAYKLLFTDYPDVVNVEQMCEMLGGICDKTAYAFIFQLAFHLIRHAFRVPPVSAAASVGDGRLPPAIIALKGEGLG